MLIKCCHVFKPGHSQQNACLICSSPLTEIRITGYVCSMGYNSILIAVYHFLSRSAAATITLLPLELQVKECTIHRPDLSEAAKPVHSPQ
jgi:ABC-type microcin C transport system permease subunit YejE